MMNTRKWFLGAMLLPMAVMTTSCVDNMDNPVAPSAAATESEQQAQFWSKFDKWQTDSCTLGDDFYMHMLGKFWWHPTDIYPDGMISYAGELNTERFDQMHGKGDADFDALWEITDVYPQEPTADELDKMVGDRLAELWQNATTMEQAMEALGRATMAGYNGRFEPIIEIVDGKPAWVVKEPMPFYYDARALSPLYDKHELSERLAYHGGQPMRRAAGTANAYQAALMKGMDLGVSPEQVVWSDEATKNYQAVMQTMLNPDSVKKFIAASIRMYDGLLMSDKILKEYADIERTTPKGEKVKLPLGRMKLHSNILTIWGNLYCLRAYNKLYVSADVKKKYVAWCEEFRQAMQKRLENNRWLSGETRANALEKLKLVEFYVGAEPDVTPDVAMPKLNKKDNMVSLIRQLRKARRDTQHWMIGRTRREVLMLNDVFENLYSYTEDNATYGPETNSVTIYPSNLLQPYVDAADEEALTLAVLGSTIGHELTHGFDSTGRKYDKFGAFKNWWTAADEAQFTTYTDQLVANYSALLMMPWADQTLYDNGKNTLGENIADIGGCCLGLDILLGKHPEATPEQQKQLSKRYFQGWAIAWSSSYDLEFAKQRYTDDVHSQARERCNGVVRNINAWYDAYDIKSGTLYLEPSKRVAIW